VTGWFSDFIGGIAAGWERIRLEALNIVSGISSAFESVIGFFKGLINGFIRGINAAIGVINLIPGVEISKIKYLARGTDDWEGGFARINEGGRGELVHLPNGTQVIPHDISMRYAREAAYARNDSDINLDTGAITTRLDRLESALGIYADAVLNRPMVLDDGTFVGHAAGEIDYWSGEYAQNRDRGLAQW
jgi:phage-related protein